MVRRTLTCPLCPCVLLTKITKVSNGNCKINIDYPMTLNDFATIQLALVGILVSVVTLLFATIVSKREEYRSIFRSSDAVLRNRSLEVKKDINKLKRYCSQLLLVIAVSFIFYILFIVTANYCCKEFLCYVTCIAGVLTIVIIVWFVNLSIAVARYFKNIDE